MGAVWTIGPKIAVGLAGGLLALKMLHCARRWPREEALPQQNGSVSATSAAERALCLAVVVMRGEFEMTIHATSRDRPDLREAVVSAHSEISDSLCDWLCGEGLWEKLSAHGKELLSKPMGTWTEPDVAGTTWRLEFLAAIAWALSLIPELPPCDRETDERDIMVHLHLGRPPRELLRESRLRPLAEIQRAREAVEAWCQERGFLRSLDSSAFSKRYAAVSPEDAQIADIAHGRLRGLNWLCGQARGGEDTPSDT